MEFVLLAKVPDLFFSKTKNLKANGQHYYHFSKRDERYAS